MGSIGDLLVLETRLISGRVQRVYKNQWPSARAFWLWAAKEYAVVVLFSFQGLFQFCPQDRPYLVFENQRYTYQETLDRAVKSAAIFSSVYGIKKGKP